MTIGVEPPPARRRDRFMKNVLWSWLGVATSIITGIWLSPYIIRKLGDEAYGSNEGYFQLKDQVTATFGPTWHQQTALQDNLYLFHQGRAAEHALSTVLRDLLLVGADAGRARALTGKLSGGLAQHTRRLVCRGPSRPEPGRSRGRALPDSEHAVVDRREWDRRNTAGHVAIRADQFLALPNQAADIVKQFRQISARIALNQY